MPDLDNARNGAPSRTLTWAISAFIASMPANLGCIAGCAAFLALYDRHVPQMRMAAQPPPAVGPVPGFDLVAVPRGAYHL